MIQEKPSIDIKVTLTGESSAGKTSLMVRQTDNKFLGNDSWQATIGIDFKTKIYPFQNYQLKARIWDQAGSQRFRFRRMSYFKSNYFLTKESQAIMVCFAINDTKSFQYAMQILNMLKEFELPNCLFYLIGCKSDCQPKISFQQIQELCQKHTIKYFQTSSKQNYGVHQAFKVIVTEAYNNRTPEMISNTIKVKIQQPAKRHYCY